MEIVQSPFAKTERHFLIFLLATAVMAVGWGVYDETLRDKLLASSGLVLTIAGILQLEVTGFFERVHGAFQDEKNYPYGPPSYYVREMIDNPDRPIRTGAKNLLFFDRRTGAWLLIIGSILQLAAVWFAQRV